MAKKTISIALDLKRITAQPHAIPPLVEGDNGNVFVITLTDDGAPVDLSACKVLAVFHRASDGSTAEQDTEDAFVQLSQLGISLPGGIPSANDTITVTVAGEHITVSTTVTGATVAVDPEKFLPEHPTGTYVYTYSGGKWKYGTHSVTISGTGHNVITIDPVKHYGAGKNTCEIQVYAGTTLVTSSQFNFDGRRAIFSEDTAPAVEKYPVLTDLIGKTEALARVITPWQQADASAHVADYPNVGVSMEADRVLFDFGLPTTPVMWAVYGTTRNADIYAAYNAGIPVYCIYGGKVYQLFMASSTLARFSFLDYSNSTINIIACQRNVWSSSQHTLQSKITANGLLKGNGTSISAAVAGTDYAAAPLIATVNVTPFSDIRDAYSAHIPVYCYADARCYVLSACNASTAWFTVITGTINRNAMYVVTSSGWSEVSLFTSQEQIAASGLLKGNGSGGISSAVAGTDFVAPHDTKDLYSGTWSTGTITVAGIGNWKLLFVRIGTPYLVFIPCTVRDGLILGSINCVNADGGWYDCFVRLSYSGNVLTKEHAMSRLNTSSSAPSERNVNQILGVY